MNHKKGIFQAIQDDKPHVVMVLIKQFNIDIDRIYDEYGDTLLMHACAFGRLKIAELLLVKGADPNAPGKANNLRPLHTAARCGRTEMVKLLVSKGADFNARCSYDCTPLDDAEEGFTHTDTARYLRSLGATRSKDSLQMEAAGGTASTRSKKDMARALAEAPDDIREMLGVNRPPGSKPPPPKRRLH